jgi:hypothetical protein
VNESGLSSKALIHSKHNACFIRDLGKPTESSSKQQVAARSLSKD